MNLLFCSLNLDNSKFICSTVERSFGTMKEDEEVPPVIDEFVLAFLDDDAKRKEVRNQ